ncbi:hypothetical protein [Paenarthrobacter sp. C1]|uniref:hypothetical protein n=1 Tax=Paenarthrobacter sp. C1 TaxID=3400220 RepID=UPI003BF587E7
MPELKLRPVTPGKLNKPAWYRAHTAELGPDHRAGEGAASLVTSDVYLNGERIGSVTGSLKTNSTAREWVPDRLGAGLKQHGTARFNAVDALVRTHLTDLQQHPIAHLSTAA